MNPTLSPASSRAVPLDSSVSARERYSVLTGACCALGCGNTIGSTVAIKAGSMTNSCVAASFGASVGCCVHMMCFMSLTSLSERYFFSKELEKRKMSTVENLDQSYMNAGNDRAGRINQPVTTQPRHRRPTTESADFTENPPTYDEAMKMHTRAHHKHSKELSFNKTHI